MRITSSETGLFVVGNLLLSSYYFIKKGQPLISGCPLYFGYLLVLVFWFFDLNPEGFLMRMYKLFEFIVC